MKKISYLKKNIDYRLFYIIGLVWLPLSLVFMAKDMHGMPLLFFSLVFLSAALANRERWENSKPLTRSQKRLSVILAVAGAVIFIVVLMLYLLNSLNS